MLRSVQRFLLALCAIGVGGAVTLPLGCNEIADKLNGDKSQANSDDRKRQCLKNYRACLDSLKNESQDRCDNGLASCCQALGTVVKQHACM